MSKIFDAIQQAEEIRQRSSWVEHRPSEQLTALTTAVNELGLQVAGINTRLERILEFDIDIAQKAFAKNQANETIWLVEVERNKRMEKTLTALQGQALLADFRRNERKVRREKPRRKAR